MFSSSLRAVCVSLCAACGIVSSAPSQAEMLTISAAVVASTEIRLEEISQPAWLIERLPEQAVAYGRIPSLWGMLGPNGRLLDPALSSPAHLQMIQQIRQLMMNTPSLQQDAQALFASIIHDITGPIEFAVLDASHSLSPASNVLATVPLAFTHVADLNQRLEALQNLPITFHEDGTAEIANLALFYNEKQQRLLLQGGMAKASASALQQLVAQLSLQPNHPAKLAEKPLDTSSKGLFLWLQPGQSIYMLTSQLPANFPPLFTNALEKTKSISLSMGTDEHAKGLLRAQIEMPEADLMQYIFADPYQIDLKATGQVRTAISLMLPNANNQTAIEKELLKKLSVSDREAFEAQQATFRQITGMTYRELTSLFGPEFVYFLDDAGSFTALRLQDAKAFQQLIQKAAADTSPLRDIFKLTDDHNGIQRLSLAPLSSSIKGLSTSNELIVKAQIASYDLFWRVEGDWLVTSSLPQALRDRKPTTSIGDFMQTHQRDSKNALVSFIGTTYHVPKNAYYAYLKLLNITGEVFDLKWDLAAMPSALELQLPEQSYGGLSIGLDQKKLDISLHYDIFPMDMLLDDRLGSLMSTTAVAGILAALGIPAYQDYMMRVSVTNATSLLQADLMEIANHYAEQKKLPATFDLTLNPYPEKLQTAMYEKGQVILIFSGGNHPTNYLVFTPYLDAQKILQWYCGGALPEGAEPLIEDTAYKTGLRSKYLPAFCKK